jgi:hypothetical protein
VTVVFTCPFPIPSKSLIPLNRTQRIGFASAEFTKNIPIFGQKFSAESTMPDSKKSTYVTYKGTTIEALSDSNIYSWMRYAMCIFIIEDLWQFVDPDQAPALVGSTQDDKTTARQVAIARAVLSFLIGYDTWQEFEEIKLAHQIWTQIRAKADQLKAQKEALYLQPLMIRAKAEQLKVQKQALYLQQLETITFDSKGMDDFISRISRKVAEIKGVNGFISDVSVSGYLIRGLPKEYDLYKPLLNSIRADVDKLKLELLKADAYIKEEKLWAQPPNSNSDSTPKAPAAQAGRKQSEKLSKNKNKKPKRPKDPNAYCMFHKRKGHDIKDCVTYKLAQNFFESK